MKKNNFAEVTLTDGVVVYFFALIANLAMQITLGIVMIPLQAFGVSATDDYFNLIAMVILQMAFAAVPLIYYGCKKKAWSKLGSPLCRPAPTDAFGVLIPVITLICFYLPAAYFVVLLDKIGYNFSAGVNLNTPGKIILGVIAMVICAPVVEELIFRGFLLSGLREKFNPYAAVILTGLAFSLMHMNPEQTVYQFFLGCACGLIAVKSGRLLPAILAHAVNNAAAILLEIPALGNAYEKMINYLTSTTLAAVLSTVILFVAGIGIVYLICFAVEKIDKAIKRRGAGKTAEDKAPIEAPIEDAARPAETETVTEQQPAPSAEQPATVNPFEGYGVPPVTVQPPQKKKSKGSLAFLFGGLGICMMMWLYVFAMSFINLPTIDPNAEDPAQGQVTETTEIDINE